MIMSSLPSSSSSSNLSSRVFSNETVLEEVIKVQSATLYLMNYDENMTNKIAHRSEFSIKLVTQAINPILMAYCTVGEKIMWPLEKDAPVIRVGYACFVLGIPGILYALQLPLTSPKEMMTMVEVTFKRFAYYEDHRDEMTAVRFPVSESHPSFWYVTRPWIEHLADSLLVKLGHIPGRSPPAIHNQSLGLLKIMRLSGSTQVIYQMMLSGLLKPDHIVIRDAITRINRSQYDVRLFDQRAFPSICIFTSIMEALEVVWIFAQGQSGVLKPQQTVSKSPLRFRFWSLSSSGVVSILQLLKKVREVIRTIQGRPYL